MYGFEENKLLIDKIIRIDSFIMVFNNPQELRSYEYISPSDYVNFFWKKYEDFVRKSTESFPRALSGHTFRTIICFLLDREKIAIESVAEKNLQLLDVRPSISVKNKKGQRYYIYTKISLRERWKIADWETFYLKSVDPNSKSVLLSTNDREVSILQKKLPKISIDEAYSVSSESFNNFIKKLKNN